MNKIVRLGGVSVLVAVSLGLAACGGGGSTPTPTPTAGVESVLHSFTGGTDGAYPWAGLVLGASGNFYGTTLGGGASNNGTVFKITPTGVESVLYSFGGGTDGAGPLAGLVLGASGNFYGTTTGGGASNNGTVFKITPAGVESVLYSFGGGTDGAGPQAGLVLDASGNLYGTTVGGGASNNGTVFKITSAGVESVLHSFGSTPDGATPLAGLVLGASGNFYGTTVNGGASNNGTVFKITSAGVESVLHSFGGGTDGAGPQAGLVLGASGNLYGTTSWGGASGKGTVFKITPAGVESVLHSFTGGTDGAVPEAGLVLDASGNLYGTTSGLYATPTPPGGGANSYGTVFKITAGGGVSVLHSFTGGTDGATPHAGLVLDAGGNLYGTTFGGGANGMGTVFRYVP